MRAKTTNTLTIAAVATVVASGAVVAVLFGGDVLSGGANASTGSVLQTSQKPLARRAIVAMVDTSHSMVRLQRACRAALKNAAEVAALDQGTIEIGAAARSGYGGAWFLTPSLAFSSTAKTGVQQRHQLTRQWLDASPRIDRAPRLRAAPATQKHGSDITGLIAAAVRRLDLIDAVPGARRDIIVCSDGELVHDGVNLTAGKTRVSAKLGRRIAANDRSKGLLPRLAGGVHLTIVGPGSDAGLSDARNAAIERFWRAYGSAAGAVTTVLPDPRALVLKAVSAGGGR